VNGALIRKELRELGPWAALTFVVWLIDVVDVLTETPDLEPLGNSFSHLTDSSVGFLWLLAFAIGTTSSTREEDDGTLAFLDGLPVSRSRVFLTKLGVAAAVLFTYPILRVLLAVALHFASRESLDQAVHPGLLLQLLAIEFLLVLSGLAFGAALGRLRSLTWLMAGCLAVGLGLLTDEVPRAAILDPLTLAEVTTGSTWLHVDVEAVAVQAVLALLWVVVAWASFVGAGRPRFAQLSKRPVVSAIVTLLTVAAAVGVMALRSKDREKKPDADDKPHFSDGAPASTATVHYRFSYPSLQSRDALALAEGADQVFEEVHRLLQVPPGAVIDVDASGSLRETAGTAFAGGLRLKLGPQSRAVLAHETCHVISRRVAGDERAWLWGRARVLNEGLASWVERRFDARPEGRAEDRLALAALHRRGELLLDELVNPDTLARERDDLLKYSAGEALIDATVQVYGVEALHRLLEAFGDPKLPPELKGLELWQACFQVAGLDLGRVLDEFFGVVEAESKARALQIDALPRPRVTLLKTEGWYGARATVDSPLPKGWSLALRFRPGPESAFSTYDTFTVEPEQPQWRQARSIRKAQLCVQAGVRMPEGNVLYEPWACRPVSEAIAWTAPPKMDGPENDDEDADADAGE
jgi:hypothetical protein